MVECAFFILLYFFFPPTQYLPFEQLVISIVAPNNRAIPLKIGLFIVLDFGEQVSCSSRILVKKGAIFVPYCFITFKVADICPFAS